MFIVYLLICVFIACVGCMAVYNQFAEYYDEKHRHDDR